MFNKSNLIRSCLAFFNRTNFNKHKNEFINPQFRKRYYSSSAASTDYSKLKPVDLSFIKFESKDSSDLSPVLILHGLFGSKNNWRSVGRMISDRSNRTTYVFDIRNHGDSPRSNEFTYPIIANDVKHFMEKNEIKKGIFIGHSLGGRAFSKLSFMFPNLVEKLVVVDVHPTYQLPANKYLTSKFCNILKQATESVQNHPKKLNLSAARRHLDEQLKVHLPDDFLRQFFLSSLCERDNKIDWKFNFDVLAEFLNGELNKIVVDQSFKGPCLLIYGGKSVYFDKSHFGSVLEIFPKMKFECVEDGNHYLNVTHYEQFLDKLIPFLNE